MPNKDPAPGQTIASLVSDKDNKLQELGTKIGKLYTDHGLPIDMALERIDCSKEQKIAVLTGALSWLIEHRRASGAPEKAIERQRKANRETLERFINTGETGVY